MDLGDDFFELRPQKRARVEPLFVSQRNTQSGRGVPTFDDFISTQNLKDDLKSFNPSQIVKNSTKQSHFLDASPGTHLKRPVVRELDFVPVPTLSHKLKAKRSNHKESFRVPSTTPSHYDSDEDLFVSQSTVPTQAAVKGTHFHTPQPFSIPDRGSDESGKQINLRSVEEIQRFREIFSFPYFNVVQSRVLDDVFYTDKPLVVCAPTGSGKTAIFELAILRLLTTASAQDIVRMKIVYMAPIKALCNERYQDWRDKFEPFGLKCKELTGDTEIDDYFHLQEVNIVTTTPEKWDSMTRKWRDNKSLVQMVRLFLIDEIHVLNDDTRGATMEAVISRMKTVQSALSWSQHPATTMRFIAVSATIPNIEDIAEWLGQGEESAVSCKLGEKYRPVRLRKVVLGYYCSDESSDFKFDISLNYKLANVIQTYSEQKPTLVFCSTRKSVAQAASVLVKDAKFIINPAHRDRLVCSANSLRDSKLRDLVLSGIGYHHAGMEFQDRKCMEEMFLAGDLPVLFSTSTLAMGVNLPAHLVIIKSTTFYAKGSIEEYSDTQVLQMIGRAGRPQFDTSATAVIMTKNCNKHKYENLIGGTHVLESSLHKHLIEHLNAEVCLQTISDVTVAVEWLRCTLLYIRVMKNPKHYNMPVGLTKNQVEKRLQDLCITNLNLLSEIDLIKMDEDHFDIKPTETGRLMARYCITYTTMKMFSELPPNSSISDMVIVLSSCKEFCDIQLRLTERGILNTLNKDKHRPTIRFPMKGRIKTKDMKVNCLMQTQLGCLSLQDFALSQDIIKIFRVGQRILRCLVEFIWNKADFQTLLNAVLLCKCFKAKLWENSKYVSKQLEGIGPIMSIALVNAGITSFEKIEETNPRELELIVNRHPPFGNQLRDNVSKLPKYELSIEQVASYNPSTAEIAVTICLSNPDSIRANTGYQHYSVLLVGDLDGKVVLKAKIGDNLLLKDNNWRRKIVIHRAKKGIDLDVCLISEEWVGLDVQSRYTPYYTGFQIDVSGPTNVDSEQDWKQTDNAQRKNSVVVDGNEKRSCFHRCLNKNLCGHECCKNGILTSNRRSVKQTAPGVRQRTGPMSGHMDNLKNKLQSMPPTPSLRLTKGNVGTSPRLVGGLSQFSYTPRKPLQFTTDTQRQEETPVISNIQAGKGWDDLETYTNFREDYNKNADACMYEEDFLPDLVSHPSHQYHSAGNGMEQQIVQWDSDTEDSYGNFGLETPWSHQSVPYRGDPKLNSSSHMNPNYNLYSPEDFQQSSDDEDGILLKRGEIDFPEIKRHPYYQTKEPSKALSLQHQGLSDRFPGTEAGGLSVGKSFAKSPQFQNHNYTEGFQYTKPCNSEHSDVRKRFAETQQFQKADFSQEFQGGQQNNSGDSTSRMEKDYTDDFDNFVNDRLQRQGNHELSNRGRTKAFSSNQLQDDNHWGAENRQKPIHAYNFKTSNPRSQPGSLHTFPAINSISYVQSTGKNSRNFQSKISQEPSPVQHKQGQVFAWQAPKRTTQFSNKQMKETMQPRNSNSGDFVTNMCDNSSVPPVNKSSSFKKVSDLTTCNERLTPENIDPINEEESQSSSPTIPCAQEFVFAKQLYEDRFKPREPSPNRFRSQGVASQSQADVKHSPVISSDGDDDLIAGCLDSMENTSENFVRKQSNKETTSLEAASCSAVVVSRTCEEENLDACKPGVLAQDYSKSTDDTFLTTKNLDVCATSNLLENACPNVETRLDLVGNNPCEKTQVLLTATPSPVFSKDFFSQKPSPEEKMPDSFNNIFDNIF